MSVRSLPKYQTWDTLTFRQEEQDYNTEFGYENLFVCYGFHIGWINYLNAETDKITNDNLISNWTGWNICPKL